jgi:hypothetical protein
MICLGLKIIKLLRENPLSNSLPRGERTNTTSSLSLRERVGERAEG